VGPFLSQALSLALIPILFRLYTPQDFGAWAVVQAIALAAGSLASLRFDLALVTERDIKSAEQLLFAVLAVVVSLSIVAGVAIVFSASRLGGLGIGGMSAALGWIWLLLVGLGVTFQGWLMREGAFAQISISIIVSAVFTNLVHLLGGLSGSGIWLIIGSVVGQAAALAFSIWAVMRSTDRPDLRAVRLDQMLSVLRRNQRFPLISLPFTVLSLVRERAPIFVIGLFASPAALGIYSQAWRLTHFPSGFTSAALRPVFFYRTASEGLEHQGHVVDRLVRSMLLACSPALGLVVFGNDALAEALLGAQWQGAGALAAVLAFPAALFAITNWMDRLLDAVGRQDVNLKGEMISGIASVVALGGTLAAGASLNMAVFLQSAALSFSYLWLLYKCYQVAGWSTIGLAFSLFGAAGIVIATYLFLVVLSSVLSQSLVLTIGAILVTSTAICASLTARKVVQ
jgi:O-antigen/teichoic acid export membrane protein